MSELTPEFEPDWDIELSVTLSPSMIIETVFYTADTVHTGTESCVDSSLVILDIVADDENSDNYCRFVEQRFTEDEGDEETWQDWTVELRIQTTYIAAHWRMQLPGSPADWEWGAKEAEKAFKGAAVLVGRRIRRAIAVEEPAYTLSPPRTRH